MNTAKESIRRVRVDLFGEFVAGLMDITEEDLDREREDGSQDDDWPSNAREEE